MNKALFATNRQDWGTPKTFFDLLDQEFHFTIDICASEDNAKCPRYFTIEDDSLSFTWPANETIYCNPPYGREVGKWLEKGWEARGNGSTVVFLLPARTDTKWFHEWVSLGEVRFLQGRIIFEGAAAGAPFPSLLLIFRPKKTQQLQASLMEKQ